MKKQRLVLLGSTGSIGKSTLGIVRRFPELFEVVGLVAGSNHKLLAQQVEEFKPEFAGLAQAPEGFDARECGASQFYSGSDVAEVVLERVDFDTVVGAIVGIAGLPSSYNAIKSGKRLLLANKESLVCAGELLLKTAKENSAEIVPVDSEHSALAQLLEGGREQEVKSLTLTASGGPFYFKDNSELQNITPAQAVKHPRWSMGAKISIDSSTLVNKALELIEAFWLFGVPQSHIDVVVHPQSIIHGLVTYVDEVQIAHLSVPDMQGPISFALMRPEDRLPAAIEPLSLAKLGSLTFFELDDKRFPAVALARKCIDSGGVACAVFNAANEVAVAQFMRGQIAWLDIVPTIEKALEAFSPTSYTSVEEVLDLHSRVLAFLEESK